MPERINPGDKIHTLETIIKVVSGNDAEALEVIANMYELVVTVGVHRASTIKVAEAAKVIENAQRDINIAFMNELSIIFNKLDINTHEVLEAARTKWNFLNLFPGLVGGHCIGIDPYYLTYKAEQVGYHSQIILAGRKINDDMGAYVVENGIINKDTPLKANSAYGKSKIEAEELINKLADDAFVIATLRPPMVYGKGCKGNYPRLASLALKTPIFPEVDNKRSMIYIDNLSEFVKQLIDNRKGGLFFPQNTEYVNTSEMVRLIADSHGKKIVMTKLFNPLLRLLNVSMVNKVFGDLVYEKNMSEYEYEGDYGIYDMIGAIEKTEGRSCKMIDEEQLDILMMCDNNLESVVGGTEESTKIIMNGLKEKCFIGVIQPGEIKNKKSGINYFDITDKTRLKHIVKKPFSFLKYIVITKEIIKDYDPKIIHTQAQVSFFIVALLKKFRLIPKNSYLIHTERGLYTKYSMFFKRIFYFFMKELNMLVTTTEFNMKYWRTILEEKRFLLEYRIIENTAGELFEVFDETLNKKDDEHITVGFAGRYTDWKNWPMAVEISEKLNAIIGDSVQIKMAIGCLDEKALGKTKAMYDQLDKTFGSRFDGKININLEEMDKFYYDIDVFILTSNFNTESFGRTLVEAMSRKAIVLTTDAGGSVEVVGNIENVHNTADEFVDKIVVFFNNKSEMRKEKERNLKRVKEVYSLDNNINKHLSMYSDVLGN